MASSFRQPRPQQAGIAFMFSSGTRMGQAFEWSLSMDGTYGTGLVAGMPSSNAASENQVDLG